MKHVSPASLCGKAYIETVENDRAIVAAFSEVEEQEYTACLQLLLQCGFEKKEEYQNETHRFCALLRDGVGVFVNYFGGIREMYVTEEENTLYFSYADTPSAPKHKPRITQPALEDFGMCYVIRLSDGRFIVIDGGRELEPDCDKLFKVLTVGTEDGMPTVAAWIFTHPHSDHLNCFNLFMDKYAGRVAIEKFLFSFPRADDVELYPALPKKNAYFKDSSATTNIALAYAHIERIGATVYTAHTGQRYRIGDALCTILASMDDTVHLSHNINSSSLVIRMELGEQIILWAADASFEDTRLADRYGRTLRADILQVPHHGFGNGLADEQIRAYELIRPAVCLLPVSDYNAYTMFCTFRKGTSYLMHMPSLKEMITGERERTITLPYEAPESAKDELASRVTAGRADAGSHTWVFSELSTDEAEDFEFTVLNMTQIAATVSVDLFFEEKARSIRYIRFEVAANTLKHLSVIGEGVDGNAVYYNPHALKTRGIPAHAPFAVRFMSDLPIVVSHKKHAPAYCSGIGRRS